MKFIIKDRNGDLPDLESKVFEFESLEQFANWSVQIELPRHVLIPHRLETHTTRLFQI